MKLKPLLLILILTINFFYGSTYLSAQTLDHEIFIKEIKTAATISIMIA
jgi:hypothetical protein